MKCECLSDQSLRVFVGAATYERHNYFVRMCSVLCRLSKTSFQCLVYLVFAFVLSPASRCIAEEHIDQRTEYRLGAEDQVRVRVHEWRPSRDEIFEWQSLNNADNYTINPSGHIALPLLGEVFASGMSTAELADVIGLRLKDTMGLLEGPSVVVEVVQYRPFYIVGAVDKPGAYPFRPGLTVLQAYSIAGGKQRNSAGMMRLEREAISTRGELRTIDLEFFGLVSRMARLNAEHADLTEFELPPELIKKRLIDESLDRIVEQEQLVFHMRKNAFETQLTALAQLQSYLEETVHSMEKRLKLHDKQVETVQQELDSVTILFKKGLAAAPRKLALDRMLAQVRGERLSLEALLMQAQQEISKTKITIVDLKARRTSEISADMRQTQARLEELRHRSLSSKQLLYETEVLAPQLFTTQQGRQPQPIFKILRHDGAVNIELEATESMTVKPGDTIRVELPLDDESTPSGGNTSTTRGQHSAQGISGHLQ